ncbi:MAG: polymer-forming cytoskeletal protein [Clostridia bacterium]|nr:polymer-forming cytoskeletal protein [Clostridia bacterium]
MFQMKKEVESNFDIIIGPNSMIKGDVESEGSIRIDGKIIGNVTTLGNVIISENATVRGDVTSSNAEIYGLCEGNVKVKGKVNLFQNSTLIGDVLAKSLNTKEGASFKGNCVVDPDEELKIEVDSTMHNAFNKTNSSKLVDINKSQNNKQKTNNETQENEHRNAK